MLRVKFRCDGETYVDAFISVRHVPDKGLYLYDGADNTNTTVIEVPVSEVEVILNSLLRYGYYDLSMYPAYFIEEEY